MAKKKTDMPSAIAVIYARYSSHSQREESIEQQVEECMGYAKNNNLQVIHVYADKALSGKSDKRPEFQKMIRHAEKKQFQVIIAYKSNRIARNMLHALAYEDKLSKFGVKVVYAKEEFGDTAAGRFALRTMMNVNQFYSENMSEDIKRGLMDNARNCLVANGGLPLGYTRGEDGKYKIVECEAFVVQEIFTRFACGDSFADIARDLNERGIRTKRGGKWGKNSFHTIISNERYTGVYIYKDIRIEGGVPQIITKELFHSVQRKLTTKTNPVGRGRHTPYGDYLLTGKLFCGKCKSPMIGMSGTSKQGSLYYYYVCQKRRQEKKCNKKSIRRNWIEEQIASAIKNHILKEDVIEWIADSVVSYSRKRRNESQLAMLEKQLSDVKRATKNLMTAIEQGIITATTKDRLLELESEQARIASKIAIEKSETIDISKEDIIAWLNLFKEGKVEDKKYQAKLFDVFLVAVYLYDDDMKIEFSFTGNKNTVALPLEPEKIDDLENSAECSSNVPSAPLRNIIRQNERLIHR